jgi:hypothetical protein
MIEENRELLKALKALHRYKSAVPSRATFEEAARILREMVRRLGAKPLRRDLADSLAKVAIILASRKMSTPLNLKELGLDARGCAELVMAVMKKHPELSDLYVRPNTMEAIRAGIVRAVDCLVAKGHIEPERAGDVVRAALDLASRVPGTTALESFVGALVYLATRVVLRLGKPLYTHVSECVGVNEHTLQAMAQKLRGKLKLPSVNDIAFEELKRAKERE